MTQNTDRTPAAREAVLHQLRISNPHQLFDPPSERGRVVFPGFHGGAEWGGPAVDPSGVLYVNSSEYLWKRPLGELPELTAKGLPPTGTENYGGPVVTAGGVLFIGATMDEKFRAFSTATGEILWETTLPAAGYATPATYEVDDRQFVVIACGGGKLGTKSGDRYVAFALPRGLSDGEKAGGP